jgi:hypothetical protein
VLRTIAHRPWKMQQAAVANMVLRSKNAWGYRRPDLNLFPTNCSNLNRHRIDGVGKNTFLDQQDSGGALSQVVT